MILKENLSLEERIALGALVELVRDADVLVPDSNFGSEDNMVTNGSVLPLYSFNKADWEKCVHCLSNF